MGSSVSGFGQGWIVTDRCQNVENTSGQVLELSGSKKTLPGQAIIFTGSTRAREGRRRAGGFSSEFLSEFEIMSCKVLCFMFVDEVSKKKMKKTEMTVSEVVYGRLSALELQKAVENEFEMALQDHVMEETKDKKNAVEAYVYEMRNKLHDEYHDFISDPEREQFISELQEVEDWLYEDGEDETKGVYVAKLEELKKQGDPVEQRYKEHTGRGTVIDQLNYCIDSYMEAALVDDPKFDHIDMTEKQKVLNECMEAKAWLREKIQHQDSLPKHVTPVLLSAEVRKKAEALDRFCRPIMAKPKPAKPATPDAPSPASSQGPDNIHTCDTAESGEELPSADERPMETDKSETAPS